MIQMKQKQSVEGVERILKPSIKKVGTMLGAGAMAVLSIGAISVYGLTGKTAITSKETNAATESKTIAVNTADDVKSVDTSASNATVSWWKAGVAEYDFVEEAVTTTAKTKSKAKKATTTKETEESTTTTTTTKRETETTTSKKTTTTASKLKNIDDKSMYVALAVNMRSGPSKSNGVITVLNTGTKVTCNAKTDDGWYRVEVGNTTGYCMAEYLTTKAPAKTTSKPTTTTTTTSKAKETTTSNNKGTPVISYTSEEFEMMCYVLQQEVGGCTDESKIAVANVIINRVNSSRFPNTIKGVLTANNQFTAIYNYYNKTKAPTKSTIDCARRALNGEGAAESKGATYYYAPRYCSSSAASWFETLTFCMELEGQRYFKN